MMRSSAFNDDAKAVAALDTGPYRLGDRLSRKGAVASPR
jgi:hypothetical protein